MDSRLVQTQQCRLHMAKKGHYKQRDRFTPRCGFARKAVAPKPSNSTNGKRDSSLSTLRKAVPKLTPFTSNEIFPAALSKCPATKSPSQSCEQYGTTCLVSLQ